MGRKAIDIGYVNDSCTLIAHYDDSRFLMGGCTYLSEQQDYVGLLTRLDFDGVPDSIFGNSGHLILDLPSKEEMITEAISLPDGKIVISGGVTFGFLNWPTNVFIARLLPNGEVDSSFLGGDCFIKNIIGGTESIKPTSTIQIGEMTYVAWDEEHSGLTFGLMCMDETGQLDSNFVQNEFVGAQGNGVLFSSYEWLPFIHGIVQAYAIDSTGVYFVGRVGGSGAPYDRNMFIAKVKLLPPIPVSTVAVPWQPLSFSAYPNPVKNGVLHLSPGAGAVSGPLSIRLSDLQGRLVWQQELASLKGEHTIDVSGLKSGMYVLDVSGQAGRWVEKVVISK